MFRQSPEPFAHLTRKLRWRGRGRRWRDALWRPLRPSRLAANRSGPPDLLLVGIDTLRADHLGCYGYGQPTSPCLDQLAGRGTLFADVMAPAPWTLPSFAGALTGLLPGLHGGYLAGDVRNMDSQPPQRLRPEVVTLAAHLRVQGYRTAAFYSNQFFAFGLAESFDHHEYHNQPAGEIMRLAREWIRRHADRPYFCFVLLNDPHEPTTPPAQDLAPFLTRLQAVGAEATPASLRRYVRWGQNGGIHLGRLASPPEAAHTLDTATRRALAVKLAIYDATIRQVDREIGAMNEFLHHHELAQRTLVSVFADHGEEFLDHAALSRAWGHDPRGLHGIGHGQSQFQELLHVPWTAWGPGVPVGVRRAEPVSLLDLAPTLLHWLGLAPLPAPTALTDTGDMAASLTGHAVPEPTADADQRLLLAEALAYGPDIVALRRGGWKLIAHRDGRPLVLFDLSRNRGETTDLLTERADVATTLLAELATWRKSGLGATGGPPNDSPTQWSDLDDTVRSRLQDLGYAD